MSELALFGVALLVVVAIGVMLWATRSKTTINLAPEPEKSLAQRVYEDGLARRSAEFDSRPETMETVSYPAYEYDPDAPIAYEDPVAQPVSRVATKPRKMPRKAPQRRWRPSRLL